MRRFFYGTRRPCEEAVLARGGDCASGVSRKANVVVIGELGSRDWAHTSLGRKIEDAVSLRKHGYSLAIVSEEQWTAHL